MSDGKDRLQQFKEYVQALNQQFLQWCNRQWDIKPAKFWSSGMRDYLRHQAKIRLEFGDVIHDGESLPRPPPPACAGNLGRRTAASFDF